MKSSYPEEMIIGIPRNDNTFFEDFNGERFVKVAAFQFRDRSRDDGMQEMSINWHDCHEALKCLFSQIKDTGEYQFLGGAAIIHRVRFHLEFDRYIRINFLSYERRVIPGNEFHGNILISINTPKSIKSLITSSLAVIVSHIEPHPEHITPKQPEYHAQTS